MSALDDLQRLELQTGGAVISTATALRRFLLQRSEVVNLQTSLGNGSIAPTEVEEFIRGLLATFTPGRKFSGDVTLAAVAVAIRNDPRSFATKYLEDLKSLRIKELPMAPRVASLCLHERRESVIPLTYRERSFSRPAIVSFRTNVTPRRVSSTVSNMRFAS